MNEVDVEKDARNEVMYIWCKIGYGKQPNVITKMGGHSACYYPDEHKIGVRWNVYNKMNIQGRRLLLIHECIHALNIPHSKEFFYFGTRDMLSLEVYRRIYKVFNMTEIEHEVDRIFKKSNQVKTDLKSEWCNCGEEIAGDVIFKDDGVCDCGINKHHYHCPVCKCVTQIG